MGIVDSGVPKEIRTPVTALKRQGPGPLDDGDRDPGERKGMEYATDHVQPLSE
jgi:hypothetical protein